MEGLDITRAHRRGDWFDERMFSDNALDEVMILVDWAVHDDFTTPVKLETIDAVTERAFSTAQIPPKPWRMEPHERS